MNKRLSWIFAIIGLIFLVSFYTYYSVYIAVKPTVDTVEVHIEETKANLNGIITTTGKHISEYGFKWGTSPDLERKETVTGKIDANKPFSTTITGLESGTTYYYQAYAVNSKGSGYGEIKSFTVPANASPIVSVKSPDDNLSITGGEVINISAVAADDKEVKSMELFINNTSKTSSNGESLTYAWDTSSVNPGEYTIKVTAWDGEKAGEKAIAIIVKAKPEVVSSVDNSQPVSRETNNNSIPVSRAPDSTDKYKYPRLSKVKGSFGQFRYRDTTGGRIEIDPQWVAENIVTITLPGLNQQVQVHKAAADNFIQAFTYIKNGTAMINGKKVSLLSLVKTMDGTFVTRHVNWNPSRGLSNHSWGTAIDINANDHFRYVNPGGEPNDPNLILWEKAFKPAGFSWGNTYSDSMHYELIK